MSRTRLALAATLATAAALSLSSCATQPGTALRVGDYTLSRDSVARVTQAQCALTAAGAQGSQVLSRASAAQSTVVILVQSRQALAYARTHDVSIDETQLSAARRTFEETARSGGLSAAQREAFVDTGVLFNRGQLIFAALGAERLGLSGDQAAGAATQQAVDAGAQVVAAWAEKDGPDISIDPRYGLRYDDGRLQRGDVSVSVPVSAAAKQAATVQQSQSYVASLPLPQRCG